MMIENILKAYDIQYKNCDVKPLSGGLINTTWHIKHMNARSSLSGQYILQKINNHVFKNPYLLADNVRRIYEHLNLHYPDYLFIAPIKTAEGEDIFHNPEWGYFRMFPFVQDSITIELAANADEAFEAALQFGRFTHLLAGFDISTLHYTIPDFHNLILRDRNFEASLQEGNTERIAQAKPEIEMIKKNYFIVEQFNKIQKSKTFKKRVTHHDTKISNVLFNHQGKGLCVIDLDTVMPGYFISDVGDMMRTYLSPATEEETDLTKVDVRENFFSAIVEGYLYEMNGLLSDAERKSFLYSGLFLTYMQAVRFLEDYFQNDRYYGSKYEGHNLMRAKNQLALLQCLLNKQADLQQIVNKELTKKSYMM